MYLFPSSGSKKHLVTSIALALVALVVLWLGFRASPPQLAQDFEECVEQVQARRPSSDERHTFMTDCNARFAGRRKAGGGYTYFDFMQNRNFDIASANPTAEEQKQIDREYLAFLDAQRREAIWAGLAKRQNEQLRADLEGMRQPVGPPMVAAKRPLDRSKSTRCENGSLTCSWAKLSAAVKKAFASSSKTSPNPMVVPD